MERRFPAPSLRMAGASPSTKPGADTGRDIWTLPLDLTDPDHPKPGKPELFLATPGDDVEPAFSPDGHWLAYTSSEAGTYQVYVRPFPPTREVSGRFRPAAAAFPFGRALPKNCSTWAPGRSMVDSVYRRRHLLRGRATPVVGDASGDTDHYPPLDLAPDGKRFVVFLAPESHGGSTNVHVNFVLNFFDELKRRVR